ncbi:MAG: VOC family protein [Anaeromyxobacter sp.]
MPRPVHFEIHAADPARAIRFYEALFGWAFQAYGGSDVAYWLVRTGEGPGIDGGLLQRMGPAPEPRAAVNAFVCTVGVDDLDAALAKAEQLGARQVVPRTAIGDIGWSAYVKDPEGNLLGMFQSATPG